jgi:hypothetical protein
MTNEDAREFVKRYGPLPESPAREDRTCKHKDRPNYPCSCHLTLEQHGVAEGLGNYTLFMFGLPYTGHVKVPYYPGGGSGSVSFDERHVTSDAELRRVHKVGRRRRDKPITTGTTTATPAKSDYDKLWRAAKAKGGDALAAFKADWKAKKVAA